MDGCSCNNACTEKMLPVGLSQKRALKLQQQKQKEVLEKEQQREKELERERQLIAKPAKRT